jgi:hypothetical protein
MSIVDDRMHVIGDQARHERLWQTPDASPFAAGFRASAPGAGSDAQPVSDSVFTGLGAGDQLWQARIDLVVSSGLSGDTARKARQEAHRAESQASFDAVCQLCRDELRPVLECSAEMLQEWGLEASVTEILRDEPARVPRGFDLALWIARFGDRGPGKLTLTATEGCDFVRIKLAVGPSMRNGEVSEHVGTTIASDLCDALVGGLVANLVEQLFSS